MRNVVYPTNLKLYEKDLPWVEKATHLGHELHQMCDMNYDCKVKRAQFISTAIDIRDTFSFAHPDQVLSAINVYAGHFYGSMLWDLSSDMCGQLLRSWNTCVKITWDVPRSTPTYLVDNLLAVNHWSIKKQLLSRYTNFFKGLLKSKSREIVVVANIVSRDVRSVTGKNLNLIFTETGLDPWLIPAANVREAVPISKVPEEDMWRLPLLCQYLQKRMELNAQLEDTKELTNLIDSLCNS